MNLNEQIRMGGDPATIVRDSGNVSTYIYYEAVGTSIAGRRRLEPERQYEAGYLFPTDSGVVSGDLVLYNGNYYLVMSLTEKRAHGFLMCYRGMLYKCNSAVSIYLYNATTKKHDTLHKSDVRCLISETRLQEWTDDKGLVMKGYRGRSEPFFLYAQVVAGIVGGSVLTDAQGRRFRVGKESDPFITEGVAQYQIAWENQ